MITGEVCFDVLLLAESLGLWKQNSLQVNTWHIFSLSWLHVQPNGKALG